MHMILRCVLFLSAVAGALAYQTACGQVVRDARVYRQEVRFFEAGSVELADEALARGEALARAGDAAGCAKAVKNALVMKIRAPYHAKMMLHLAGRGPDPGAPPPVPEAAAWCAERSIPGSRLHDGAPQAFGAWTGAKPRGATLQPPCAVPVHT